MGPYSECNIVDGGIEEGTVRWPVERPCLVVLLLVEQKAQIAISQAGSCLEGGVLSGGSGAVGWIGLSSVVVSLATNPAPSRLSKLG